MNTLTTEHIQCLEDLRKLANLLAPGIQVFQFEQQNRKKSQSKTM